MNSLLRIHLYTICWNESQMLPYFLRHYGQFCESIVVYDNGSDDGSQDYVLSHPACKLRQVDTNGRMQEDTLLEVKGHAWKECRGLADWVICCDIDEFLFHPQLVNYLRECQAKGVTLPVPQGYQMVAARFPTTHKQIYDEVQMGFAEKFYSKRIVFNPTAIDEINYSYGCHSAQPVGDVREESNPALKLLHFKFLGPEYVCVRNAAMRARQSDTDLTRGFGHQYQWSPQEITQRFLEFDNRAQRLDL